MKRALLVTLLLTAAPLAANAQSTGQGAGTAQGPIPQREPNLANPQAQDNEQAQSAARPSADSSQATSIPTPTLSHPMTPTNNQPSH